MVALIITVIVIIIIASIVIFAGIEIITNANFAKFTYEFQNYEDAITNHHNSIREKNFLDKETRSDEQIYYEIATKIKAETDEDVISSGIVDELGLELLPEKLKGTEYYEITDDNNILEWSANIK